jgi:radical SAM superfamily enzyme YgiQ (UPF0313 family)
MRVVLASSLHLDHGGLPSAPEPGHRLPMQTFVPMGLLSLKAVAEAELGREADISVHELNSMIAAGEIRNDDSFYDAIADKLLAASPDLVGLMTDADSLHHTTLIADRIKARSPSIMVCAGGPTTTPIARMFLERMPAFDLVVRGEGELTFAHLLRTLASGEGPGGVRGLTWRDGAAVIENPDRPLIDHLDDLPMPDFDAYPDTGTAALYLDVGRGCPFKCRFCSTAPFWERRYRMKSATRIIDEMRLLRDRWGRTHVNFAHDIFTANQRWTGEFCEAMLEARLGMTWSCSTRTDTISPALLGQMAEAGCDEIYYGIESGSTEIQKRIDKNLDLQQVREVVVATREVGIRPVTGLIIGYPFETEETLSDTLETFFDLLQCGGYRAHLFTLCPFPQAPMFGEHAREIERLAEYHDLPLVEAPAREAADRIAANPDLFSSCFRFSTPGIESALVDASEEISAHIVLLRRLWPLLLGHYPSAFDLYRRWVSWIQAHNRRRRPDARLRSHGDVRDLLDFLSQEMPRLGLQETLLASMIRYESIKHAAAYSLEPASARGASDRTLAARDRVVRSSPVLMAPFSHDLRIVVGGGGDEVADAPMTDPFWVLFAKDEDGSLSTVRVNSLGRRIIELADSPRPLGELIGEALLARPDEGAPEWARGMQTAQRLMDCNLLALVEAE